MESFFQTRKELSHITACLHFALPAARQYFFLEPVPFYLRRPITKYINAELRTVKLQSANQREFMEVYIDDDIRIPDYPYTFVLETWSRESLMMGWLVIRTEYIPDGIRLHEKAWIPNPEYDLPELTLFDIELVIETPDHFFDRPGQMKHTDAFRYTSMN